MLYGRTERASQWIAQAHSQRIYGSDFRAGIFKLLRSPGLDFKESIPPAYVASGAGTRTIFLIGSLPT